MQVKSFVIFPCSIHPNSFLSSSFHFLLTSIIHHHPRRAEEEGEKEKEKEALSIHQTSQPEATNFQSYSPNYFLLTQTCFVFLTFSSPKKEENRERNVQPPHLHLHLLRPHPHRPREPLPPLLYQQPRPQRLPPARPTPFPKGPLRGVPSALGGSALVDRAER